MTAPFRDTIELPIEDLGEMELTAILEVTGSPYARASHPDGPSRGTDPGIDARLKGAILRHSDVYGRTHGLRIDRAQVEMMLSRRHVEMIEAEAIEAARVQ